MGAQGSMMWCWPVRCSAVLRRSYKCDLYKCMVASHRTTLTCSDSISASSLVVLQKWVAGGWVSLTWIGRAFMGRRGMSQRRSYILNVYCIFIREAILGRNVLQRSSQSSLTSRPNIRILQTFLSWEPFPMTSLMTTCYKASNSVCCIYICILTNDICHQLWIGPYNSNVDISDVMCQVSCRLSILITGDLRMELICSQRRGDYDQLPLPRYLSIDRKGGWE